MMVSYEELVRRMKSNQAKFVAPVSDKVPRS